MIVDFEILISNFSREADHVDVTLKRQLATGQLHVIKRRLMAVYETTLVMLLYSTRTDASIELRRHVLTALARIDAVRQDACVQTQLGRLDANVVFPPFPGYVLRDT